MNKQYYIQGPNDNTCGLIALINCLVYYDKPIPSMRKLRKFVDKYELVYGSSKQDILSIGYELGLYLNCIKIDKQGFSLFLKNKYPILVTGCRIKMRNHQLRNIPKEKMLDFKLHKQTIKDFSHYTHDSNDCNEIITGCHSTLMTEYDRTTDRFKIHNIFSHHPEIYFDDIVFDAHPNKEKWDCFYYVTTEPIKKVGLPNINPYL